MTILIQTLLGGFIGFLKFYIILLTLRVYLTWFPNINMYMQPFVTLGKMTDPYLRIFRGFIPPLLSLDLSALVAFICLTFLIDSLSSLVAT